MASDILDIVIAEDLKPITRGGITMYPAADLDRIFNWAESQNRKIEWLEGVFFNPEKDEGQLSLEFIIERDDGSNYEQFRATCERMASEVQISPKSPGMNG